jgi:hypothetical protein
LWLRASTLAYGCFCQELALLLPDPCAVAAHSTASEVESDLRWLRPPNNMHADESFVHSMIVCTEFVFFTTVVREAEHASGLRPYTIKGLVGSRHCSTYT